MSLTGGPKLQVGSNQEKEREAKQYKDMTKQEFGLFINDLCKSLRDKDLIQKKLAEIGYPFQIAFTKNEEADLYQYMLMANWKDGSIITNSKNSWEERGTDKY